MSIETSGGINECMGAWIDEQMDGQMTGWMDG